MKRDMRFKVDLLKSSPDGFESGVAVSRKDGSILAGALAEEANEEEFLKLYNWKLLLGLNQTDISGYRNKDRNLDEILRLTSLEAISREFFKSLLNDTVEQQQEIVEKPQVILGIPPTTRENHGKWRKNFRSKIETVFDELGYPKPKFWPEPFAVFQYHLNRGDIKDLGSKQNVLIVDIGGGTTDVCLIQTTHHGRLARGGVNHAPHGVKSAEVGGSSIDQKLLDDFDYTYDSGALIGYMKASKEQVSREVNDWGNMEELEAIIGRFELDDKPIEVSAKKISQATKSILWDGVRAAIEESLGEVREKPRLEVEAIDIVILAGGVSQMGLIEHLFRRDFSDNDLLSKARIIVSDDYKVAVAHGLAIEAAANSRHHDLAPTRVSAYLQEDLKLEVSHTGDSYYLPGKLKSDYSSQGDMGRGVLLSAPKEIGGLVDKPRSWNFRLKQNSKDFFYKFSKTCQDNSETILEDWKRISRKEPTGRQLRLDMTLHIDGFAKLQLETMDDIVHELKPLDLHDLSGLEGDSFFSIDFGTDNTQIAYVNLKDPGFLEALPSQYQWQPSAERQASQLEAKATRLLGSTSERIVMMRKVNKETLADYVYHSNRIEGSELDRGETQEVLSQFGDTEILSARDLETKIAVINEHGEIVDGGRLIKDKKAALNLKDAFEFVEELAGGEAGPFTVFKLREIHSLVMRGDVKASPGHFRKHEVNISQTSFVPPDFTQVGSLVDEMFERFESEDFQKLPAIVQAVEAHARFVSIHPYADGNGRVARLIANYFMWKKELPGFMLPWGQRERYYDALEECNSKEPGLWGNLTDLLELFSEVFESTLKLLEPSSDTDKVEQEEELVIETPTESSEFGKILIGLKGDQKSALNYEEQYQEWKHTMEAVISEVQGLSGQLDRAFRASWGGNVSVRNYPIIDFETYRAIRLREQFSRTWCLKLNLFLPNASEELILFFRGNSRISEELNPRFERTCSLHISRYIESESSHVDVERQSWCSVGELLHDGSDASILLRTDREFQVVSDDRKRTDNWFGLVIKDLLSDSGIEI